jgi:hypothetical protein
VDDRRTLRRHPDAVEAEVDGQRVVMSPRDFGYFGLEGTGAVVWDRLEHTTTLDDLVGGLAEEFATEPDTVRSDVTDFVDATAA